MPERITIVCLANSRKHSGRCVAGIAVDSDGRPQEWVRPVSDRPGSEVSELDRKYKNGTDPKVLDVISVPLVRASPRDFQTENWLLEPSEYWVKTGEIGWGDLDDFLSPPQHLWPGMSPSTYNGSHDRLTLEEAEIFDHSLLFIKVDDLLIRVFAPGAMFGEPKRRVQTRFTHRGRIYWVWTTDPVIEREFLSRPDGEYRVGVSYLTVSLGEPHEGFCYKMVAAVIRSNL